jgi:YHS domain-containing protein
MKRAVVIGLILACMALVTADIHSQGKGERAKDPVCGLSVDKDPDLSASFQGETYYFCSKADRDLFRRTPEKYVKKK